MSKAILTDGDRPSLGRSLSGVPGLDDILGGGLFVGGVYLLAGRPGAGKTILATQIAFNHVARGGRALYVTLLAESHARMLLLMESMSFFSAEAVGVSLQYLSGYQTLEKERLVGLAKMLRAVVRDHNANLLVIDGLLTAHDLAETDIELKKFVHDVQMLAEVSACTTIMLRGAHDSTESYPERTMADGLISLTNTRTGMRRIREIEVEKHRGSAHMMGTSVFEISSDGVVIYPRTEARIGLEVPSRVAGKVALATTGVASLDAMLRGGLSGGTTTVLLGSSGVGKTLLGLQFLDAGTHVDEPALYFGFGDSPAAVVRKAKSIGIDLAPAVERGLLEIAWHPQQEPLADRLVEGLFENIRRRGVRRVFIDGFEGLRAGLIYPERAQAFAVSLDNELRSRGVTAVISEEIRGLFGPELQIPPGAADVADNVLFLRQVELRSHMHRLISVMKLGDHAYETSLREFRITDRGLDVASTFETAEAILTGLARASAAYMPEHAPRTATKKPPRPRPRRAR